jgi:hypothetical protein
MVLKCYVALADFSLGTEIARTGDLAEPEDRVWRENRGARANRMGTKRDSAFDYY